MNISKYDIKNKCLLILSIGILLVSMGLRIQSSLNNTNDYKIDYEYVNVKDMAASNNSTKISSNNILVNLLASIKDTNPVFQTVEVPTHKAESLVEVELPDVHPAVVEPPRPIWRLPTEMGRISQYPHYGHVAYDITSPRGAAEYIFPVANGTISSIYTDAAGALIVTVLHEIDGVRYTSLYAHLSSYAEGIYVGKPVTVNDVLGRMGTTGYSTGVHLHLVLIDCALYDPNDNNCSNLGGYFNYTKYRFNQGYYGLGSHLEMPNSWDSR